MRRTPPGFLLSLLLLWGCDSSPTDPNIGPDGQLIPTTCETSNTVTLGVGEAADFPGAYARYFCVVASGGSGNPEEYTLVLSSHSQEPTSLLVRATHMAAMSNPAQEGTGASVPDASAPRPTDPSQLPLDYDFDHRLREQEIRDLSSLIGPGGESPLRTAPAPAAIPTVGQIVQLNAHANAGGIVNGACTLTRPIDARVEVVSARAIVMADTQNPPSGFLPSDYQRYAAQFDTLLAPLAEEYFGGTTDIDANGGRTILLFTKDVNRLTPATSTSFTAGFFFARDLFPKQGTARLQACPQSNEAELLYLLVPDPTGMYGKSHSRFTLDPIIAGTIIHEHQHLINAGRRLHINRNSNANWSEEVWLNEGLSHIAEELLFFRASNLGPRRNISSGLLNFTGAQAILALERYQRLNFFRFFDYLARPSQGGPFGEVVTLELRGAAWSFLRYTADRWGTDQAPFFRLLVNSPSRGFENLGAVLGSPTILYDRMADWRVAIYADGRVPDLAERHQELSWNLPSIHAFLRGGSYPIRTETPTAGVATTYALAGGGAAYLRLQVPKGSTGTFSITRSQLLPPETVRATLLRTN